MRFSAFLLIPMLALPGTARAAAAADRPQLEQTDVFVAGEAGVCQYRIPGLLTSNRGTLLAFCDARLHREGDPPNEIHLVLKRSLDGGRTWSALQTVAENGAGAVADACGLVDRQTGTLWIFSVYAPVGVGSANAQPGLRGATFQYKAVRSDDDGATWSAPIDLTAMVKRPEWSAGSTGVGRGWQLRSGRLIVPRYHAEYRGSPHGADTSASYVSYSDDHGKTWKIGADVLVPGGSNECQVAELSDGTLMINLRSLHEPRRQVALSRDGGMTWAAAHPDEALVDPCCQGSLLPFTAGKAQDRDRLLFANAASTRRENLTVRVSYDDGRTWRYAKSVHRGPAAYSCLTVLPDLSVGCLYEAGEHSPYEKITFARFNLAWLSDGQDAGPARR